VLPGNTAVFTLLISGGQEVAGGFNVSAPDGLLAPLPGATDTRSELLPATNSQELTHTDPKPADGLGVVRFSFAWTAPANAGSTIIYGAGNSVNLNGNPSGDAPSTAAIAVQVDQLPQSQFVPAVMRQQ
jgi:hypothetical protein